MQMFLNALRPSRHSHRLALALVVALLLAPLAALHAAAEAKPKPNIIFVLFDDLGYGQPRYYRAGTEFKTPNLDRLAQEGMRFTDAHAAASVCTPTRYGVITGRYISAGRSTVGFPQKNDAAMSIDGPPGGKQKKGKRAQRKSAQEVALAVDPHESYSVWFDRSVAWDQKTPLLKGKNRCGGNEEEEETPPGKAGQEPAKKPRSKNRQEQDQ